MTGGWRIAVRNLRRNRRRNLATGLAIALGYAALVFMSGYARLSREGMGALFVYLQHVGHVSIYRPGGLERAAAKPSEFSFSPEEQEAIVGLLAADPRIEFAGRYLRAGGLAGNGCKSLPFLATGVEPEVERRILAHPEVRRWVAYRTVPIEGVPLTEAPADEVTVALTAGLAGRLKKHARPAAPAGVVAPVDCASKRADGDPFVQLGAIDVEGSFNAIDARVSSVQHATLYDEDQVGLTIRLATLQHLLATDRVTSFSMYLRDPAATPPVARDLAARLARAGIAAEVHRFDEADANPYYVGVLQLVGAMLGFVGLLVVGVASLSVLNAMTLTVMERTRELATFRSLGFTRGQVTGLYLREAAALTALGIAAGLLLGLAGCAALTAARIRIPGTGMAGTFQMMFVPSASSCAVAALAYFPFSLAATWLAVRRNVARPVAGLLTSVNA